eukprot:8789651-Pyramimonas_sp.AAC.1
MIQYVKVIDQPTGYDWCSQLRNGIRNSRADFYGGDPDPAPLGEATRARPKRENTLIIQDD